MSTYSIKDIANVTGIKAHTLRIWEQRYQLIIPNRTKTNIRTYSDTHLKKFLKISLLKEKGYKISEIACMDSEKMEKIFQNDYWSIEINNENTLKGFISHLLDFNETGFLNLFNHQVMMRGFEETIETIIFPLMHRIGYLWVRDSIYPITEHFVSEIVRRKLHVAIDSVSSERHKNYKRFILLLPEGEHHEFGILYAHYLIKYKGHCSTYLGQSTPFQGLSEFEKKMNPDYYVVYYNIKDPKETIKELNFLKTNLPTQKLIISTTSARKTELEKCQLKVLSNFEELNRML